MQKNKKKYQWSEQELQLLTTLYPLYVSKKWKHIADIFRQKGYNRTEIECREKWINFLDPEINRNDWQEQELEKLYEIHDQVGTKWCVIQKYIGRTQNKIKNRFYGTLRNYVRFVVNCLEDAQKSYNYQIGKLSPKFLNDMYKAQNQFRFLNEEIRNTIAQMRFKVDRDILAERIQTKKNLYERLKGLILKAFAAINKAKASKASKVKERTIQPQLNFVQQQEQIKHGIKQEEIHPQQPVIKQEEGPLIKHIQSNNYYPFLNYPFYPMGFFPNQLQWQ